MAVATTTWLALAALAASAGVQYENNRQTVNRADNVAVQSLHGQAAKQKQADARVEEEVQSLKNSTADSERQQRLANYMDTIQRSKGAMTNGLTPQVGSDTFKADAATALAGVEKGAADRAGLMARVDAPLMQRQGEGFGFGKLATDIDRIGSESRGMQFVDELRMRAIRRNPYMDLAASGLGAVASNVGTNYGGT